MQILIFIVIIFSTSSSSFSENVMSLGTQFDWRERGAVTPVKEQKGCLSDYAFAAVEAIESRHCIRTGNLLSLSVQQVIDCSDQFGNNGCHTGTIEATYRYIKTRGLNLFIDYPYVAQKNPRCKFNWNKIPVRINGFRELPGSEDALFNAVGKVGPVAVVLDFADSLRRYKSGIYSDSNCYSNEKHAALVIGYGSEKGVDYWILKNSWVNWCIKLNSRF